MNLVFPPLYAIIDAALLKTSELSFAEMMAESGVELLQYRNKRASSKELFEASQAISARLSALVKPGAYAPRFMVNDRLDAADTTSANYIAFGPIFPTASKENPDPVVGFVLLRQARQHTRKPLVAIGGITLERAADTFRAGADSLAIARDLIASEDPAARARLFLREAARARGED